MEQGLYHQPVMREETGRYLVGNEAGLYVDGTLGGGGHSGYLLRKYPRLRIIAVDWDAAALETARAALEDVRDRVRFVRENFRSMKSVLEQAHEGPADGILVDLGVSSRQLDDACRGFSFQSPSLDMRMDDRRERRAFDLVNSLDAAALADLFYTLGEERMSRPIARLIVNERRMRPVSSGPELAGLVERVKRRRGKVHPATQVFQALRIAVNGELDNLSGLLADLPALLKKGGRAVIISYHSLEDRLVKHHFRALSQEGVYRLLTKKVVIPGDDEMRSNARSRSAKLRAAEKLG